MSNHFCFRYFIYKNKSSFGLFYKYVSGKIEEKFQGTEIIIVP